MGDNQPFDLAAHQRERIRVLERENNLLREHRCRLERILALTLKIAAGDDCDPRVLLEVIYEIERESLLNRNLVQLLRDTDPAKFKAKAVA